MKHLRHGRDGRFQHLTKARCRFQRQMSDAATRDEQELAIAEYVLGWRAAPHMRDRITFSADLGTWIVYDRHCEHPEARQIAVYRADNPGQPDYSAAQQWNEGRDGAVWHYQSPDERTTSRRSVAATDVTVTTSRTSSRESHRMRPGHRRSGATSSSSAQDPGDPEPASSRWAVVA